MATEIDIDYPDAVDADTREEEEALAGHQVNPSGFDYACIAWQPLAPDSVSAGTVGWEATRPARRLVRSDFTCSKEGVAAKLCGGLAGRAGGFRSELAAAREHSLACASAAQRDAAAHEAELIDLRVDSEKLLSDIERLNLAAEAATEREAALRAEVASAHAAASADLKSGIAIALPKKKVPYSGYDGTVL